MKTTAVNPWNWQDALGFSQAFLVEGGGRVLFCSGQASVDPEGRPLHRGDMVAQFDQALANLESVLRQAGMTLQNVVRLNYYVTDMQAFARAGAHVAERLGCKPPGTLLGVATLFHPDLLIEMEATAVA